MQRLQLSVETETPSGARTDQLIDYQGENEIASAALQVAFEESIAKGRYGRPTAYKKVAVLTLRWEDEHDNLNVRNEVESLEKVFHDYRFDVTSGILPCRQKKSVQTTVNRMIADWVDDNDDEETLLIVYYAGHGRPGESDELVWYNNSRIKPDQVNEFVWNKAEHAIQDAVAHVLLIFDCCHAGDLRGPNKTFEYLAATGRGKTTPGPGPASFTSALIWAFKELSKEHKSFTTSQLTNKIKEAPQFRPDQKPVLTNRDDPDNTTVGRIMLYQLPNMKDTGASQQRTDSPTPSLAPMLARGGKILTVHLELNQVPKLEKMGAFGSLLSSATEVRELGVERIRWGGLRPTLIHRVMEAFSTSPSPRDGKSRWAALRGILRLRKTTKHCSETPSPSASSQETAFEGEEPRRISRASTLPLFFLGPRKRESRKSHGSRTLSPCFKSDLSP